MSNKEKGGKNNAMDQIIREDGYYEPYDFWLSLCGIYNLFAYSMDLLGDVRGKKILDCGCGVGHTSIMLAKKGAIVTGFDTSGEDLDTARELAEINGVNIDFREHPFESTDYPDEHFDLLFGAFILHHVDLERSCPEISRVIAKDGKAVFIENSARNKILMWAREKIVGSYGVPKYGDDDEEHPLTKEDVRLLEKSFPGTTKIHHPELLFLRLVDFYVLEKRSKLLTSLLRGGDSVLGMLPGMKQLSYFQIVEFDKK